MTFVIRMVGMSLITTSSLTKLIKRQDLCDIRFGLWTYTWTHFFFTFLLNIILAIFFLPDKVSAVWAVCGLFQVCGHELMSVDLMDSTADGTLAFSGSHPLSKHALLIFRQFCCNYRHRTHTHSILLGYVFAQKVSMLHMPWCILRFGKNTGTNTHINSYSPYQTFNNMSDT